MENISGLDKAHSVKKILEKDIQRDICDWLAEQEKFFWRHNNTPIFGKSNDGRMRFRSMGKYGKHGLPDIIVLDKGIFHGIEVKRPGCSPTPEQIAVGRSIELAGGKYYVVHSLREAVGMISF